jgi:phosphoglycolate phosphatase
LPVPPDERARHIIGLGLHDAMAHVLPELPPADYPRVVDRYRIHFLARDPEVPLFAGAQAALEALKTRGHVLAVATGKSRRGLDRALERTGTAHLFEATRCGEEDASKPAPDMLHTLMDMLDAQPREMLMIGDTTHDLEMASHAGVPSVAVAYGAHPRAQLEAAAPLACLDTPQELWQWLERNA